jgi:class 3 adenylate cyclase
MDGIVERFNAVNGIRLAVRAGIDTGPVSSGLVGRTSVVYDMWGDAVNLANRLRGTADHAGVFITGRVYEKLGDAATVSEAGQVETQAGVQQVWHLESLR